MAKFKQDQIIPGVTKTRSNAVKVYCSGAVAANDLISVVGAQGDFMSVSPADSNGAVTLNSSTLLLLTSLALLVSIFLWHCLGRS